jgi:hypothetical protein
MGDRDRLRSATYSIIAVLLLASPMPVAAQEKPIEIGVLALGPRTVPAWNCGPAGFRLASAERRRETMPFYGAQG